MADRPELQVDIDEQFETHWKIIQRVLMVVLSLAVAAGLAGLLGRGPLSKAEQPLAAIQGQVSFEHLARNNTSGQIAVQWRAPTPGPLTEITLDNGLLGAMQVVSTTPTASAYRVTPDGAAWSFTTPPRGGGRVVFNIQTFKFGPAHGHLRLLGQDAPLNIFVFP